MINPPIYQARDIPGRVNAAVDVITATAGLALARKFPVTTVANVLPYTIPNDLRANLQQEVARIGWRHVTLTDAAYVVQSEGLFPTTGWITASEPTKPHQPPTSDREAFDAYVNATLAAEAVAARNQLLRGEGRQWTIRFPEALMPDDYTMGLLVSRAVAVGWTFYAQSGNVLWLATENVS